MERASAIGIAMGWKLLSQVEHLGFLHFCDGRLISFPLSPDVALLDEVDLSLPPTDIRKCRGPSPFKEIARIPSLLVLSILMGDNVTLLSSGFFAFPMLVTGTVIGRCRYGLGPEFLTGRLPLLFSDHGMSFDFLQKFFPNNALSIASCG